MNGPGNKTNVDSFETKPKKGFVTLTFFRQKQQVAQVNFDTRDLALKIAQALLSAHFGDANGPCEFECDDCNRDCCVPTCVNGVEGYVCPTAGTSNCPKEVYSK